jgi:two-component system, OmpR family, phosphate regulon sensor histidine kinase PhoR
MLQTAWLFIVVIGVIGYIKYNAIRVKPIGMWDIVVMIEASTLLLLILVGIYILFILYQRQLTLMRTQMHFISSITHAFKTPLATMQLYLETIKKRDLPEETKLKLLNGMIGENTRLKSLVDNFLASARLSYSRKPYEFSKTTVSAFIQDFLTRHESMLKEARLATTIRDDAPISIDMEAMNLVFSNLAENAIHYSNDAPQVDIEAWHAGSWAYIQFSDSGIGIPKERHRDIFKMFQRLPEARAMWGSGTGIGLYVVKMIIQDHGGNIKVSEDSETEGTSFLIRLPVVKQ